MSEGFQGFFRGATIRADMSAPQFPGLLRNGMATREVVVLSRDADSGMPAQVLVQRPLPYSHAPVVYRVGASGGTVLRDSAAPERIGLPTIVVHPDRLQEQTRGSYPTLRLTEQLEVKNLSSVVVQVEGRGAEGGEIASTAPISDLLINVEGRVCTSLDDKRNDPWYVAFENKTPPKKKTAETPSTADSISRVFTRDPGQDEGRSAAESSAVTTTTIRGGTAVAGFTTSRGGAGSGQAGAGAGAGAAGGGGGAGASAGENTGPQPAEGLGKRPMRDVLSWAYVSTPGGTAAAPKVREGTAGGSGGQGGSGGGSGGASGGGSGETFGTAEEAANLAARINTSTGGLLTEAERTRANDQIRTLQRNERDWRAAQVETGRVRAEITAAEDQARIAQRAIDANPGSIDQAQRALVETYQRAAADARSRLANRERQEHANYLLFLDSYNHAAANVNIQMQRVEYVNGVAHVVDVDQPEDRTIVLGLGHVQTADPNAPLVLGFGGPAGSRVDARGNIIVGADFSHEVVDEEGNTTRAAGRTLGASIFDWPPGSPQYVSAVQAAQHRHFARPGAGGSGGSLLGGDEIGSPQDLEDQDTIEDGAKGDHLGTAARARAGLAIGPAEGPPKPRLAILLDAPFTIQPGDFGYPLAFDSIGGALSQPKGNNIVYSGPIFTVGHFIQGPGNFWRPIVPIPPLEKIPSGKKKKKKKEGGPGEPPGKKKCGEVDEKGNRTPTPGGGGDGKDGKTNSTPRGKEKEDGDGELSPCDSDKKVGLPPQAPTGLRDPPGIGTSTHGILADLQPPGQPPLDIDTAVAQGFGGSAIQPEQPAGMSFNSDQRERLGGGPYHPQMSLVPRGGIRLMDPFDFAPNHSAGDVINFLVGKVNQLISLVNDMRPMDTGIETGGAHIPNQTAFPDPALGRFRLGDEVQVLGQRYRLGNDVTGQPGNLTPTGKRAWYPVSADGAVTRELGPGRQGQNVEIRFKTGFPELAGRKVPGDAQPKIIWDGVQKVFAFEGAPVQFRVDRVSHITGDGTEIIFGAGGEISGLTAGKIPKAASATTVVDSLFADSGTVPSYNGNTIWHAGNDGAGTGLDADTVDGQHAAAFQSAGNYARLDSTNTYSAILNYFNGTVRLPQKADPGSPDNGEIWNSTTTANTLKFVDNSGTTHIVETRDRINAVNGYAGLDAGALIPNASLQSTVELTTRKNAANGYAGIGAAQLKQTVLARCGASDGSSLVDSTISDDGTTINMKSSKVQINSTGVGFFSTSPVSQRDAIANASGGVVIDAEARTALNGLLAHIRAFGLMAT